MAIIGFPLLLIPLAVCNIIVFLMPGLGFDAALARVALPSGAIWTSELGDMVVACAALLLLLEVMKAGRPAGKYVVDHLLSVLVFGGTAAEFVVLPQFGNVTMFQLSILALVDVLAGFALRGRTQRVASRRRAATAAAEAHSATASTAASAASEQTYGPSSSASAAAASIAEAVLLDPPEPVAASAAASSEASPSIQSPQLQPAADAATASQR